MRRLFSASGVLACLSLLLAASAQRPDFSGTWFLEVGTRPLISSDGLLVGSRIHIAQDSSSIRISLSYGRESVKNPPVTLTVRLDGVETPNTYHPVHRAGLQGSISSNARWDGARLVITTSRVIVDADAKTSNKTVATETLSLDGGRLIVERVVAPRDDKPARIVWIKQ